MKEFDICPVPADPYDAFFAGIVDEVTKHFGCARLMITARTRFGDLKLLFAGAPAGFSCQKISTAMTGQLTSFLSVLTTFYYTNENLVTRIVHNRSPLNERAGIPIGQLGLKPSTVLLANQVAVSIPSWHLQSEALTVAELAVGLIVAEEHEELRKLLSQHQFYYHLKDLEDGDILGAGFSLRKNILCKNFRWVFRNPVATGVFHMEDVGQEAISYISCDIHGVWRATERMDKLSMPLDLVLRMPSWGYKETWRNGQRVSGCFEQKIYLKARKLRFWKCLAWCSAKLRILLRHARAAIAYRNHLRYRPGGPGYYAAREEFLTVKASSERPRDDQPHRG